MLIAQVRHFPALRLALPALPPGAAAVQLRDKELPARDLLGAARELVALAAPHRAPVLVNDRADVALLAGAAGVQLPGHGLGAADARALLGSGGLVGRSIHEPGEAADAGGADFCLFAPVFPSPGKQARGLAALGLAARAGPLPVFALGGVDESSAAACLGAGAAGVACIRAVLEAPHPAAAARRLWAALSG